MGRNNKIIVFISFFVLVCQLFTVEAALNYVSASCLTAYGNYTENSVFHKNLDLLISNLSSQASVVKFKNLTVGQDTDRVYGLLQCRLDLSLDVCSECIKDAKQMIAQKCPLFHEAIVWYYQCMLRYASHPIFSIDERNPSVNEWVSSNVSSQFTQDLAKTMDGLVTAASTSSNNSGYFATREANLTFPDKLYSLAQCTSDLDAFECNTCLRAALAEMNTHCSTGCIRATAFSPSCQLRYDVSLFYNETHLISLAPPPSKAPGVPGKKSKTPIIAGIAVAALVGLLLILGCIWLWWRNPKKNSRGNSAEAPRRVHDIQGDGADRLGDVEFVQYDLVTLKSATGDFSDDNKLGEGGFGIVYKGILESGEQVAIKRLSGNSGQGAKEFMTEAQIVAKLQHRNLVKLYGFCLEGSEKLLVYEFMPNKSLDFFLFVPMKRALLGWDTRYKIIMGIARGLQYLHQDSRLTIVHRDLKTSNILLDKEMNAKIADFGLAKLFGGEQRGENTSRIVGTFGYMAPEYMLTGEYSDKTDVYSFGIIVLEIVSGRRNRVSNNSQQKEELQIYAWNLWKAGRSLELMDPTLENNCSSVEVMRCLQIAMLCVQGNAASRPTMTGVVLMLTGSITLPSPSSPALASDHFNIQMADVVVQVGGSANETDQHTIKHTVEQDLYPR